MTFLLTCLDLFLFCTITSAFVLNLTTPISSHQAPNKKNTSSTTGYLQLGANANSLKFDAECNGPASGVGLTKENCQDAVMFGIPDQNLRSILQYGDRRFGRFDINLPQRYISGDGRCVIDITLLDIHKVTPYFPLGLALAATFLGSKCVGELNPPQGGNLVRFGKSSQPRARIMIDGVVDETDNMRMIVHSYKPNVVCVGQTISPDIQRSCQSLLDSMAVGEDPITFGHRAGESTVWTPYSRVSADQLCVMEIDTSGVLSDTASWRDFWEVGVALNGVCIRKGREGFQINIGANGGLHMELKDNRNLAGTLSSS